MFKKLALTALLANAAFADTLSTNEPIYMATLDVSAPYAVNSFNIFNGSEHGGIIQIELSGIPESDSSNALHITYESEGGELIQNSYLPDANGNFKTSLNTSPYSPIEVTVANDSVPDDITTFLKATLLHDQNNGLVSSNSDSLEVNLGALTGDSINFPIHVESQNGGIVQIELAGVPENNDWEPIYLSYTSDDGELIQRFYLPDANGNFKTSLSTAPYSFVEVNVANDSVPDDITTFLKATLLHDQNNGLVSSNSDSLEVNLGALTGDSINFPIHVESQNGGIVQIELAGVPENNDWEPIYLSYTSDDGELIQRFYLPDANGNFKTSLSTAPYSFVEVNVANDSVPDDIETFLKVTLLHDQNSGALHSNASKLEVNLGENSKDIHTVFPISSSNSKVNLQFINLPENLEYDNLFLYYTNEHGDETYDSIDAPHGSQVYTTSLDVEPYSEIDIVVGNDSTPDNFGSTLMLASHDNCYSLININTNYNNRFDESCFSEENTNRLAHQYAFYVDSEGKYNVEMWSIKNLDLDSFVYLKKIDEFGATIIASDDNSSGRTELGARIQGIKLSKGWYRIEATTLQGRKNGRHIVRATKLN